MRGIYWEIEQHAQLTAGVRAFLLERYGYTPTAGHTWAAVVSVVHATASGETCLGTFPFSFVAATYVGNVVGLEAAIQTEVVARLAALRNTQPLTSILDRRHWL